jgi:hypothetical protein
MEGRFTDNGDGTVTDHCTGLVWQKSTMDADRDGVITAQDRRFWGAALTIAENLELGGHSDWRLPNLRELQSLIHYGRPEPRIDPLFHPLHETYWSSTANLAPWYVGDGYALPEGFPVTHHFRAVREP